MPESSPAECNPDRTSVREKLAGAHSTVAHKVTNASAREGRPPRGTHGGCPPLAETGPRERPPPASTANLPSAEDAEVSAPADDDAAVTHGSLFADLRDYTSYVEAHGNRAGATLLERYRALVRGAVASFHGAEIRTEGDSFYVVFGSVGPAVRCGLAIFAAAAATAADPDPIRAGVGVHAGETIETAEGLVGSAVNIAARLCAEAKAGELVRDR